jgi:hypothetical protein
MEREQEDQLLDEKVRTQILCWKGFVDKNFETVIACAEMELQREKMQV